MGAVATVVLGDGSSQTGPAALDPVLRALPGSVRVLVVRWPDGTDPAVPPTDRLADPALVSVAAVSGGLSAAGLALALACDLRVFADDVVWSAGGTDPELLRPLVGSLGYARALELCLTGRRVGAQESVRLGVAAAAVPRPELDEAVDDLVAAVLATDRDAAVETKALLQRLDDRPHGLPTAVPSGRMAAWT